MKRFLICLFLISSTLFAAESDLTFSMIKPLAVKEQHIGGIVDQIEKNSLTVVGIKMVQLTPEKAKAFYKEHEGKPFFNDLVTRMSSGPIVALVIQGNDAVAHLRQVVGATDPKKAAAGTIRALFGRSVTDNAIHASDSAAAAAREVPFFFTEEEIFSIPTHS